MKCEKRDGKYYAVDNSGAVVAYIERNFIGTHGHSSGWLHMVIHEGKATSAEGLWFSGSSAPWVFRNIKDFRSYYGC